MSNQKKYCRNIYALCFSSALLVIILFGAFMGWLLSQSIKHTAENHLTAYSDILIASTIVHDNTPVLVNQKALNSLPRYWQISANGNIVAHSEKLSFPLQQSEKQQGMFEFTHSDGTEVSAISHHITFPGNTKIIYVFGMAKPLMEAFINQEYQQHTTLFVLYFLGIAVILLLGAWMVGRAIIRKY